MYTGEDITFQKQQQRTQEASRSITKRTREIEFTEEMVSNGEKKFDFLMSPAEYDLSEKCSSV